MNDKNVVSFRISTSLLEQCDSLLDTANCRSRNEFVEKALQFYCGYLSQEQNQDYLAKTITSAMSGMVDAATNRLARMDFKLATEIAITNILLSPLVKRTDEERKQIRAEAVEEVRRLNGIMNIKD